jgi:aquaporin Z
MEAAGLGLFMVSAGVFAVLLEAPGSPLRAALPDPLLRRALMGLAMGGTAIALIYSPWGRQSGAHLNPAVTLTFLRLGKVEPWDAVFYALAQGAGGALGVLLVLLALGRAFADPPVGYVATLPGSAGTAVAFAAEAGISGLLMLVVLTVSNHPRLMRTTGLFAGALVAAYITVEAPLSGMSMNPARTFASALPSLISSSRPFEQPLWIYFLAPPLGMLLAAQLYLALATRIRAAADPVACAKLVHATDRRCIFCGFRPAPASSPEVSP